MTDLRRTIEPFAAADVTTWQGLPAELAPEDLAPLLVFDERRRMRAAAGDPPVTREWVAADTSVYAGGLRLWLDESGTRVVALEGIHPLDAAGAFVTAPDLGEPDATYDAVLGPLVLEGAERLHARRGLAVRVNPDNGLLLGLVGFAPTDVDDYRTRIRPFPEPTRPLHTGGAR